MAQQWQIEASSGHCAVSGRALAEGEEFYAVLFEEGESFRRADYSLDAWDGPPEGAFSYFKTRAPWKEKRKRLLVDDEILVNFFLRLVEEIEPLRLQFRFVLALILLRKRLLRYDRSAAEGGIDVWQMTLMTDKTEHRVINPDLSDEQIEGVSQQLSAILHGDMGSWAEVQPEGPVERGDDEQPE